MEIKLNNDPNRPRPNPLKMWPGPWPVGSTCPLMGYVDLPQWTPLRQTAHLNHCFQEYVMYRRIVRFCGFHKEEMRFIDGTFLWLPYQHQVAPHMNQCKQESMKESKGWLLSRINGPKTWNMKVLLEWKWKLFFWSLIKQR